MTRAASAGGASPATPNTASRRAAARATASSGWCPIARSSSPPPARQPRRGTGRWVPRRRRPRSATGMSTAHSASTSSPRRRRRSSPAWTSSTLRRETPPTSRLGLSAACRISSPPTGDCSATGTTSTSRGRLWWRRTRFAPRPCSRRSSRSNHDEASRMMKSPLLALVTALTLAAPAAAQVKLNGAGATFPNIIYQDWMLSYNQAHPDVQLNYKSSDARIAAVNPGVKLPATDVVVVHRSDGSGTSFIWTDYLSKVSAEWEQKVGRGTSVNWPVGLGGKGNEGVTATVKQTPGAIGYVELGYAMANRLPAGIVRNKAGKFITPALESITAAAAGAMQAVGPSTDFRVSITNPEGEKAYPIASFTWFLLRKDYDDAAKAGALVKFVWWAETEGQTKAEPLGYAPLPKQLRPWIEARLKTISAGGKPVWTTAAR